LQCQSEENLKNSSFISDRGIDGIVYSMFYLKDGGEFANELLQSKEGKECVARYKNSMVFVIEPYAECITDDKQRMVSTLEEVKEFTKLFHYVLQTQNIPYQTIDTPEFQQRVEIVMEAIVKWKKTHHCPETEVPQEIFREE